MHIYFGERMLKGYCFPFLVRNCISYERIQYINDIYKIQYTLLSSIWFVKIVKISTNLKEESKEREGGREEEIGLKIVFQTQTLLPRGFQKKWQSAWNQTVERGEGGTGKKHRSRGIRARWTCWDLFRLVQVHWSDPGPGLWKKIMHGSTEREKKKDKREVWARLLRRWKSLVVPSRRLDSTFLNASMIILLSTIHLWKKHLNISNTLISNCSTDVYNGTFFFLILFFSFPPFNLNLRVVSRSELLDHETYNLRKISITKV